MFLEGGEVVFKDELPEANPARAAGATATHHTERRSWEGMGLVRLVREVRHALVDTANREKRVKPGTPALPAGLRPPACPRFVLPEDAVRAVLMRDPILGPSYDSFMHSRMTMGNTFFRFPDETAGNLLNKVMRDAAIVRLLELAGYVDVPDGWYEKCSRNWVAA